MLNAADLQIHDFSDLFALLPRLPLLPRARRWLSKSFLRSRRLAKRNAVLLALAADRTGTGRGIARALYRELRRDAAGRPFRSADADAREFLLPDLKRPSATCRGRSQKRRKQTSARPPSDFRTRTHYGPTRPATVAAADARFGPFARSRSGRLAPPNAATHA
jgi:hypothetical protein